MRIPTPASVFQTVLLAHASLIHTARRSAVAGTPKSTFLGACRGIVHDYGPFGFYKGVGPFVTFDGLSGCVKFAAYELLKKAPPTAEPPHTHTHTPPPHT